VLRGVMPFEAFDQPPGLGGGEGLIERSLAVNVEIRDRRQPLSLGDIADAYRRRCVSDQLISEAESAREQRRRAWVDVYREFLTEERRLSLSGVGLIRWSIRWPSSLQPPEVLLKDPWFFAREDALRLTYLLLDHLRRD
jgi:hypothetical protein